MRPAHLISTTSKYHYSDEQGLIRVYFGERAASPEKALAQGAQVAFDQVVGEFHAWAGAGMSASAGLASETVIQTFQAMISIPER